MITFADGFAGVGGFHLGLTQSGATSRREGLGDGERRGGTDLKGSGWGPQQTHDTSGFKCVWANDIDKYAAKIYQKRFPDTPFITGDIRDINADSLPDFDVWCSGFPCQSFSVAGKRRGLDEARGTLFYEIARIAERKRPRLLLLENVKGLLSHDEGRTFATILRVMGSVGYRCEWQVLNSKWFGVPQNRERVFIIGHRKDQPYKSVFPITEINNEWNVGVNDIIGTERVYQMPSEIPENIRVFLSNISQGQRQELSRTEMQEVFSFIQSGIQEGTCGEVEREPKKARQIPEGNLQEVEGIWGTDTEPRGNYDSGTIYRVVQIPTKKVLLLWFRGESSSISFRQIQQQELSFDHRSNGQLETILNRQHSTLLLAVQPYQGRLFYSLGDGRDWTKIYSKEVDSRQWQGNTLSSILEANPDPRYFLSQKSVAAIMKQGNAQLLGLSPVEDTQGNYTAK